MASLRNRILAIAAFGLAAICASAIPAAAQNVIHGSFTLPDEVRWQSATLPAGDYTFSVKSGAMPCMITLNGPKGGAFVFALASDEDKISNVSILSIEHRGGMRVVRELYLAQIGLRLEYSVPKVPKNEKLLAQGPATTEQVLVSMTRK
jgi:hypothetical protein